MSDVKKIGMVHYDNQGIANRINSVGMVHHNNQGITSIKDNNTTENFDLNITPSKEGKVNSIDLSKISTSANGALNGDFVLESKINKKSWEENNLLYKIRDDGAVAIIHDGVIIGFTTKESINVENINVSNTANDENNQNKGMIHYNNQGIVNEPENIGMVHHDNQGISNTSKKTEGPSFNQGISNIKEANTISHENPKYGKVTVSIESDIKDTESTAYKKITDMGGVFKNSTIIGNNPVYPLQEGTDAYYYVAATIENETYDGDIEDIMAVASVIANRADKDIFKHKGDPWGVVAEGNGKQFAGYLKALNGGTQISEDVKLVMDLVFNKGFRNTNHNYFNNRKETVDSIRYTENGNYYYN